MNRTPCPDPQALEAFALGKLAAEPTDMVAEHLETCVECLREVTRWHDKGDTIVASLRMEGIDDAFEREPALANACQKIEGFDPDQIRTANPSTDVTPESLPVFGSYRAQRLIGQGGMGSVYAAIHTELNKQVAIKILPSDRLNDQPSIERFRREMRAVGRLEHQNLVRAMDAGEADGTHFLAMELVYGLDVSEVVKRFGPLPIADACEIIRQAAMGLDFANQHDMVHRDIKPSNLMLGVQPNQRLPEELENGSRWISSETGNWVASQPAIVKVMDMGLALLADSTSNELTGTGQMMGTIDYMAPEQINDTHSVDIRADLYALGASLYRLLTGKTPHHHVKKQGTLSKLSAIANDDVPRIETLRTDVPPEVADLAHRMLEKDVQARIQTPSELAERIQPFCQGSDLSKLLARVWSCKDKSLAAFEQTIDANHSLTDTMHDDKPQVSPFRDDRRNKRLVWLLAVSVAVLLAAFGIYFKIKADRNGFKLEIGARGTEKQSEKVNAKPTNDDSIERIKVTPDGRNGTFTLVDALKQAKPGQTLDLEPGVYSDDDGVIHIDVPDLKIRGNRSRLVGDWFVRADNFSIDSVDFWSCHHRLDGGKIEVTNCRFNNRLHPSQNRSESIVKNCVVRLGGGYECQFNLDHCTLIEVPLPPNTKHGYNALELDCDYRISNSLIMGSDFVFGIDEVKRPRSVKLTQSLLWSKTNQIAIFQKAETVAFTHDEPGSRSLHDLDGLNIDLTNCMIGQDPKFVFDANSPLQADSKAFFNRDFRLQAGSPAKGAAEDGTDMGAIPDADGWPLKPIYYKKQ